MSSTYNVRLRSARMVQLITAALICAVSMAAQPACAVVLNDTAIGSPALAVFNGNLYLAWTGTDSNNTLNIARLDASGTSIVTQKTVGSNRSFTGPALAAYSGNLYLAWTGSVGSGENLNIAVSSDGLDFTGHKLVGSNTSFTSPALAASSSALYIAWAGNDPNHTLNAAYSIDGLDFTGQVELSGVSTGSEPALAVYNSYLYLGYSSPGEPPPEALLASSITPPLSFSATGIPIINGSSGAGPALGTVNGELFLGWNGLPNNLSGGLNVATFQNANTPQTIPLITQETIAEQTGTNPALAGFNGHLYLAWTGTNNKHNINIVQVY